AELDLSRLCRRHPGTARGPPQAIQSDRPRGLHLHGGWRGGRLRAARYRGGARAGGGGRDGRRRRRFQRRPRDRSFGAGLLEGLSIVYVRSQTEGSAMIDVLQICTFNAAYAGTIDSDALEDWPSYFTEDCHYRITHVENEREGLPAGIVYATSRAMLQDRVSALREANIYERQRYRHMVGMPVMQRGGEAQAE